jgi:hypothetical protein
VSGLRYLTYAQLGKETVSGTSVPATRQFFPDGDGIIDEDQMLAFGDDSNRGLKTNVVQVTTMGVAVGLAVRTAPNTGLGWDELSVIGSQLRGAQTGAGGAADKTWTFTPVQTGASAPESYTWEVGDDTQEVEVEYCHANGFEISAARNQLTQATTTWFGRQVTKSTKTAVASNAGVKIPGYLWTLKHAASQAGLTGASVQNNLLRSFRLNIDTGLRPHFYLDGNQFFGQMQESGRLSGTLELVVDSTSFAVSEYLDKWRSRTMHITRLKATGDTLGGSNYSAQFDLAIFYEKVQIIGQETDGVNQYMVTARLAEDSTWANSIVLTVVNSLSALP